MVGNQVRSHHFNYGASLNRSTSATIKRPNPMTQLKMPQRWFGLRFAMLRPPFFRREAIRGPATVRALVPGRYREGDPCPAACCGVDRFAGFHQLRCGGDRRHGLSAGWRGICIVSVLGYGIDAHAHRATLNGFTGKGTPTSPPRSGPAV